MSTEEEIQAANDLLVQAARLVRRVRRMSGMTNKIALIRLMSVIDEIGPSTVTQLSAADMTSQPTTTITVQSLLAEGWVTKRPHPHDARASLIELTDTGREQITRTRAANGTAVADQLAPYDVEDLRRTTALLAHLTEERPRP